MYVIFSINLEHKLTSQISLMQLIPIRLFLILVVLLLPVTGVFAQIDSTFNTNATFIVPDGVKEIRVQMWGAGGGGRENSGNNAGGGGGGGAYAEGVFFVTPGQSYTITVGAGGGMGVAGGISRILGDVFDFQAGGGGSGAAGDAAGAGGVALFTSPTSNLISFASFSGGSGGAGATGGGGPTTRSGGGGGGSATAIAAGGAGDDGGNNSAAAGGTGEGNGGSGGFGATAGTAGNVPGGGGGGKGTGGAAGAGANGRVIITYQLVDAANTDVSVNNTSVLANGSSTSTITITVRDGANQPINGLISTDFDFTSFGDADVNNFSSLGAGEYTFTATNTTVETVNIGVEVLNISVGNTGNISFILPVPNSSNSTVTANPTVVPATGTATSTITLEIFDNDNAPILNLVSGDFSFSGEGPTASITNFTDEGGGTYTFKVSNPVVETINISFSARSSTIGSTGNIEFVAAIALYSFKSGPWNDPETWTQDPSGTTAINQAVPDDNNFVTVLVGRTVTLTADVTADNLSVFIEEGGVLDLSTFQTAALTTLEGGGRLRSGRIVTGTPNVAYYPTVTNNHFITSTGGTVEFYQQGDVTLPTNIPTYRNLTISNASASAYTFTQASNIQLFGNLRVNNTSTGSLLLQLGNNTTSRELTVNGNVTISAGSTWEVGNFNTNHIVQIGGDLVNNGSVIMTRRSQPVGWPDADPGYTVAPSEGRAEVTFTGASNNKIDAFGLTRFYRLVVDKGIDQTDILTVNSTNVNNFQIFGQNNQSIDNTENPESDKALFIRNGTLRLRDNILIPSLTEGGRDFVINKNAALWIDGATVFSTRSGTGNAAITIIGKIRVSGNSSVDTRGSVGFVFQRDAEIIIEGGEVRMSQFRPSGLAGDHRAAFVMSGGLFITDGNGDSGTADGRFSLRFEENSFTMSGGEIRVSTPRGTDFANSIDIRVLSINQNVTGGTIRAIIPDGTNNFRINSTAPFHNLIVEKVGAGAADARLDADLVILNNLTVDSGTFNAFNDFNLTVGGNFILSSGSAYTPNDNTTTFNGSGPQTFNLSGSLNSGGFYNFVVDNASDTLTIAGTATSFNVRNNLQLLDGGLNDGGKTIEVAGNITNSGTHKGTGKIVLNPTGNRTISGDGTGIFGNLDLSGSATNIIYTSNAVFDINGELAFIASGANQRILDMAGSRLQLNQNATLSGFNEDRFIRVLGTASAGGVTKEMGSATTFTWPVGVGTKYTPATITYSVAPTQSGSINIRPVDDVHPAVDNADRALNYYWKVSFTGTTLGAATVSKEFNYLDGDLGVTIAASEEALAPALYEISSNQWSVGVGASVDEITNTITFSGSLYENTLTGDYTAGDLTDPAPFIQLETYYSRTSGNWFSPSTWSTDPSHSGAADIALAPSSNAIVVIGGGHTVTMDNDDGLAAFLSILENSTLDIVGTVGHNFGVTQGPTYGTFRIGSNTFPEGDFLEFLENGTTVYYRNGADFTLPTSSPSISNLDTYYNLEIDAEDGNLTMPDLGINITNDFVVKGNASSNHVRFGSGANTQLTVDGSMRVESGSFRYRFDGTDTRQIEVLGDLEIASGATLGFYDDSVNRIHSLVLRGNLINNGTLDLNNNVNRHIRLIFRGSANKSFSGAGTSIYTRFEVDKGTTNTPKITYSNTGTRTAADNAYVFTNGTIEFARPGTFVVSNTGSEFTLASTSGITVNDAGATVRIGYNNNNNADLVLRGRLEILNGLVEIGNSANNVNNDIVYAAAGSPELFIRGGVLDVNGQIRRSTANVGGALNYRQSGNSSVLIRGRNATDTRGMLEVTNDGSFFELKDNALIQIFRGGSNTYADFYVRPTSFDVSGGTVLFKPEGVGSSQNYLLDVTTDLYNVEVENDGASVATLNQQINNLVIQNNLTIRSQSIYNSSNLNIFIGGRFTREANATFNPGDNTVTFTGNASEISGDFTNNSFFNLVVQQDKNLTLLASSPIRIRNNLTINTGAVFDDGSNLISLLGNVSNNGTHLSAANNSTTGIEFVGTSTQTISGTGIYGNLNVNTTSLVSLAGNIEIANRLTLTLNSLNLQDRLLTFGLNGEVTNYGAARYLRSNGVLSDGGVRKRYPSGAANFEFPIGVFSKYTPATINILASTAAGTVTIKPINVKHPSHRLSATNLLQYYWNVTTTGFDNENNLEVTHSYKYLQADVSGDETTYLGGRFLFPNWEPLLGIPGAVDDVANLIELVEVDYIRGDFTAGEGDEFDAVSTFYSRDVDCDAPTGCNWDLYDAVEENYPAWSTTGHNGVPASSFPSGEPVIIKTGHRVLANGNTRLSESLQLNGTAEIDLEDYFSHNFGVVTGTGTIRIKATGSNQYIFPGGNYEGFAAPDSGNVVFYGDVAGVLPTQTTYNNVVMLGSSAREQANVDWTVNGDIRFEAGTVDNTEFSRNISLRGDWENNASATLYDPGTGKLIFIGSGAQAIKGSFPTNFGFIEMNGSGTRDLQQNVIVEQGMIFNTSRIYLNDSDMTWKPGATVGGTPSSSSMIVVNGDGLLRREVSATGSLTFPIGDTTGTADYTPATINFTSGSFTNANIEISVVNQADVNCGGGNFINRFWRVEMNGISSFAGTGTFTYVDGDIFGNEADIFTLSREIASTNCEFGPAANTGANTLSLTLSSTGFIITGGDSGTILPPTVQVSDIEFVTVTSTTIEIIWDSTAADGDGRIVLVRADNPVAATPSNNTFYTADSNFSGSPDAISVDNFVVYDGDGNTFTLTGLDPNRRYYFSIFEYNTLGAAITYLTTAPPTANQRTKFVFELSFTGSRGWRMMAFPFENVEFGDVFDTSQNAGLITQGFTGSTDDASSPNLLWYEESVVGTDNQRWRQPANLTDTTAAGRGYMYYVFGKIASDTRYENLPEVTDIEISLETFEQSNETFNFGVTYSAAADTGWNLVGNPFAGDLDWDGLGWTKTNMMDAIYVWDPSLSSGEGGYLVWADESGDAALGGIIPQGQAFWVKAEASPTLIVTKDALVTGGNFFGKEMASSASSSENNQSAQDALDLPTSEGDLRSRNQTRPALELVLRNGRFSHSAHVVFKEHSRRGVDRTDAYYLQPLNNSYVSIYTLADGEKLSINALPREFNTIIEIPVEIAGFENGVSMSGEYTLSLNSFDQIPDSWSIEIVDRTTGSKVFWKVAGDNILNTAAGDEIKLTSFNDSDTDEIVYSLIPDALHSSGSSQSKSQSQNFINHRFDLFYDNDILIKAPGPGEPIRMKPIPGTSRSRFLIRINPNGEFPDLPETVQLWQNYPNPFNPSTTIKFGLPLEENVLVEVYDILGRRVVTLARGTFSAGIHEVQFNARNYASGVYFVRLVAGSVVETRKMMLLK
jgi:fibronectin-binding autotransporter adhesin